MISCHLNDDETKDEQMIAITATNISSMMHASSNM
jgi:hypothetical protein